MSKGDSGSDSNASVYDGSGRDSNSDFSSKKAEPLSRRAKQKRNRLIDSTEDSDTDVSIWFK